MKHTVLLVGASGEIGRRLTNNLIACNSIGEVHLLNRRPLNIKHEKVVEHIVDFENLAELSFSQSFDLAFCCLGTTIKQAGSQHAFFHVDYDHCISFAQLALKHQCHSLSIISSLGANATSHNFYLQTKGKMEKSMQSMDWRTLLIFRPSLLVGQRSEFRIAERIGGFFMQAITPLMLGPLKQYRPINMDTVASAMCHLSTAGIITKQIVEKRTVEKRIIESQEIELLGQLKDQ